MKGGAQRMREWRARYPDKAKAAERRDNNSDAARAKSRRYHNAHRERRLAQNSEYRLRKPYVFAAKAMRRKAAKLKATPSWADQEKIAAIYAEAARLTAETGIRHEVDHIFPLQSKLCCGLHVHNNLQILTKLDNLRKGNKLLEDGIWLIQSA